MALQVESALGEVQRYLDDEIPAISAAEALATILAQPPHVFMQQVGTWAMQRSNVDATPVSSLLFFALKKIYIQGELRLLDPEAVANYLDRATTLAIRMCPEVDRDLLRSNLSRMRQSRDTHASKTDLMRLPSLNGNVAVPGVDAQTARRFSMIVDRLMGEMQNATGDGGKPDAQAVAQLLTMAASRSQSDEQLKGYLEQLRPLTGGKDGNVFIILGGAMPAWDMAGAVPGGDVQRPSQVNAMEKIIDLAEDKETALKRFKELVVAAIHKFNDGALGATIWMLDVATEGITEKGLELVSVYQICAEAADAISSVQLRKYSENRSKRQALKIFLDFFPTLHRDALFKQLRGEPKAERRRTLLGLIEAHALDGRDHALEELEKELARSDADTYYVRNLIYLLHRIPRESNDASKELQLLTAASARGQLIYNIKEAATAIGLIANDQAVNLLTTRLAEFEVVALRNDTTQYPAGEVYKLLDRLTASLARIGTAAAIAAVVRHALRKEPQLGDTRARLIPIAQHDLSFDEELLAAVLKALKDEIPGKLLGRLMPKKQDGTVRLIEALAGTRNEAVEDLLGDIAQRFPEQDVGAAASLVLGKWAPPPKPSVKSAEPVATLTGELEFFGLPSILQSLNEMRASGMLTLRTKQGQAAAKLVFVEGKFINAMSAHIRGTDALYQTLEHPVAGSFAFVPYAPEKMKSENEPIDIMGLLLEGVRRHDELQTLTAVVPDAMILAKGNTKPAPHEDEDDPGLVREVWLRASAGMSPIDCEKQVATDSFRIRRLLAHWLEQGSLVAKNLS